MEENGISNVYVDKLMEKISISFNGTFSIDNIPVFEDDVFLTAIQNTFTIAFSSITIEIILGFIMAKIFFEIRHLKIFQKSIKNNNLSFGNKILFMIRTVNCNGCSL